MSHELFFLGSIAINMKGMKGQILTFVVLSAALAGCNGTKVSEKTSQNKLNVFRYPMVTNPTTLDPAKVTDQDTHDMMQNVVDTLVIIGEDNEIHPHLAEKYWPENQGKTYVFKLKKGVKFHNGKEMTAEDVAWTFSRNASPKLASPAAMIYLNDIVGFKEFSTGKTDKFKGVEVRGKYIIAFHLDGTKPYFPGKLTLPVGCVMPKGDVPETEIVRPEELISTGPFILKEYVRDHLVKMVANKSYFEGAPYIDGIDRPIIKDPSTRFNKYRNGEVDMIMVERQDIPAVMSDPKIKNQLRYFQRASLFFLALNQKEVPAFKDVRVKQAIAMAIDKDFIVKDLLGNVNTVANSLLPPGMPGYRPNAPAWPYNPVRAKQLLAEAGYGPEKKPLSFDLYFRVDRPDIKVGAEAIMNQLKKNLGITVRAKSTEWTNFIRLWGEDKLPAEHMRWLSDYLDPQDTISIFCMTDGPENHVGFSNKKVDELCKKADNITDLPERLKLYNEAEDIALRDCALIPLYYIKETDLISPRVHGLRSNLITFLPQTKLRLESK